MSWSDADRKRARSRGWYGGARHERDARTLLRRHWRAVMALAAALLGRPQIPGPEAEAIILDHLDPAVRDRIRRVA